MLSRETNVFARCVVFLDLIQKANKSKQIKPLEIRQSLISHPSSFNIMLRGSHPTSDIDTATSALRVSLHVCACVSHLCVYMCVSMCAKCWLMYLWLCQPFGIGGTGVTLPQSPAQTSHITAQWGNCATHTFQHRALGLLQAGGSHLCVWESGCVKVCVCVCVCFCRWVGFGGDLLYERDVLTRCMSLHTLRNTSKAQTHTQREKDTDGPSDDSPELQNQRLVCVRVGVRLSGAGWVFSDLVTLVSDTVKALLVLLDPRVH